MLHISILNSPKRFVFPLPCTIVMHRYIASHKFIEAIIVPIIDFYCAPLENCGQFKTNIRIRSTALFLNRYPITHRKDKQSRTLSHATSAVSIFNLETHHTFAKQNTTVNLLCKSTDYYWSLIWPF